MRETAPKASEFDPHQKRLLLMLIYGLWGVNRSFDTIDDALAAIWPNEAVRRELVELLMVLARRSETLAKPLGLDPEIAASTHARYSRDEALAAFGVGTAKIRPSCGKA